MAQVFCNNSIIVYFSLDIVDEWDDDIVAYLTRAKALNVNILGLREYQG